MKLLLKSFLIPALFLFPLGPAWAEVTALKLIQPVLTDDKEGTMKQPEGIACNEGAAFVVADSGNGRLLNYTFKEGVVGGGTEIKVPQLPYPGRLQMNAKGEIFVLDGKLRRIGRLNAQGGFIGYLEIQGLPSSAAVVPRSFKLDPQGNIYLLDIFSERVLVLDPAGKFQREIKFPTSQGQSFFSDLAVNINGDVLLLDSVNSIIYAAAKDAAAFAPLTKSLKQDMDFPVYLTTDGRGILYVVDQNGGGIIVLDQQGAFRGRMLRMGWKPGFVAYPSQICLNGKGVAFIADRDNNRVQIFEVLK